MNIKQLYTSVFNFIGIITTMTMTIGFVTEWQSVSQNCVWELELTFVIYNIILISANIRNLRDFVFHYKPNKSRKDNSKL